MVFDIFAKYLILLYFMIFFSNYGVYFMFSRLLHEQDVEADEDISNRFTPVRWTMHSLYFICFLFAFSPRYGAVCQEGVVYRKKFIMIRYSLHLFGVVCSQSY